MGTWRTVNEKDQELVMDPRHSYRCRATLGLLTLTFVAALFAACQPMGAMTSSTSNTARELRVGDAAPDFALRDQNLQEVRLSDFRGKTVQLAFYVWAMSPG
jgi:hypothetical protein